MIEGTVTRMKPGAIQLTESWEVLFNPLQTCLVRVGGIGNMMTEIEAVMYCSEAPTWRDDVFMVGHFDTSIRFSLDRGPEANGLAPSSREAFQDRIMQIMREMGYEGWSVVDRVVTAQANDE